MRRDATKIILVVAVVVSAVFIVLPFSQKMAVRNVISPVLLLPANLGNVLLYNFTVLKTNVMKYDERCNRLALENALLAEKLGLTRDSLREAMVDYEVVPARIIERDLVTMNRLLFVDKGSASKIEKELVVIYSGSTIGRITDVTGRRSTVTTVLNPGVRISARVKRSGVFCMTVATNEGLMANYIQKDGDVETGDTIITSGLSDVMPAGLDIATVVRLDDGEDMFFKKVFLKTMVDISKLQKVYVMLPKAAPAAKKRFFDPFRNLEPRAPAFPPP